jgi:hypothetical protein
VLRVQLACARDHRVPRRTAPEGQALVEKFWPSGSVNRTVHATSEAGLVSTADQAIRRGHDRVNSLPGDITQDEFKASARERRDQAGVRHEFNSTA